MMEQIQWMLFFGNFQRIIFGNFQDDKVYKYYYFIYRVLKGRMLSMIIRELIKVVEVKFLGMKYFDQIGNVKDFIGLLFDSGIILNLLSFIIDYFEVLLYVC